MVRTDGHAITKFSLIGRLPHFLTHSALLGALRARELPYESLGKINLNLRSFETGNLSADNFKKYSTSMGRHLSPRYGQVILVSGYPVLTAVNWSQHWAKLARKCESKHWFPCVADGRSPARCTVMWLPNFLGWVDLLSYGAVHTRGAKRRVWSSAINMD